MPADVLLRWFTEAMALLADGIRIIASRKAAQTR